MYNFSAYADLAGPDRLRRRVADGEGAELGCAAQAQLPDKVPAATPDDN
ncbi:hypothetical protein [Streptomyces sp. NPDC052042]